ncbi:hypothetical protein [Singulisphaera sp. GP187]|uniref:hypothetical protein n=1 Tax=Singulisphaera sp. GP187 TaxID=1882752 RepID=UPI001161039B|nr:hypothetical protein [Singulisphaera sp. GP187]
MPWPLHRGKASQMRGDQVHRSPVLKSNRAANQTMAAARLQLSIEENDANHGRKDLEIHRQHIPSASSTFLDNRHKILIFGILRDSVFKIQRVRNMVVSRAD